MSEITLRPARPTDEAAVNALSAQIWEGEDYVPRRFADWVADDRGEFTVACDGNTVVGFGKLTELAPGEWWLEGLRVHPDHRGRGIARKLHHYVVDLAATIGRGIVRFATNGHNEPVHKLARETDFRHVAAYNVAEIDVGDGKTPGRFVLAGPADVSALEEWLQASDLFAAGGGLFEERWKWKALLPRLSTLRAKNRIYWWQEDASRRAGFVVVSQGEEEILWLNYLDADREALPDLCRALSALARRLNRTRIKCKPPAVPFLSEALTTAGWEIEPDFEMWVFERSL
ncbi:MAG: GNAT family N-acetyltransferase [Candidatus Promineifilaceae bacterium]|nr:GNAT family N-acetyltransferase [Candidatus Promineifilaceae bacterium]